MNTSVFTSVFTGSREVHNNLFSLTCSNLPIHTTVFTGRRVAVSAARLEEIEQALRQVICSNPPIHTSVFTGRRAVKCLWGVFVWGSGVFLSCVCVCRGCCSLSVCVGGGDLLIFYREPRGS